MKTDDLVSMLARHSGPLARATRPARLVSALLTAIAATGTLMWAALGVRPDLAQAVRLPMFWVKVAFPTLIAVPTLYACWRLAHPGMRARASLGIIIPTLAAMLVLAAVTLTSAAPEERAGLVFG